MEYTEEHPDPNTLIRYYTGEKHEVEAMVQAQHDVIVLIELGWQRAGWCWTPETETLEVVYHRS